MIEKETALNYLAAGLAVLPADKTQKRPTMAKSGPVPEKSEDTARAFLLLFPLLRNNIKIARVSVFSVF